MICKVGITQKRKWNNYCCYSDLKYSLMASEKIPHPLKDK